MIDLVTSLPRANPVAVAFFLAGCAGIYSVRALNRRFLPSVTIPEQAITSPRKPALPSPAWRLGADVGCVCGWWWLWGVAGRIQHGIDTPYIIRVL
jgi:hypothetical protein